MAARLSIVHVVRAPIGGIFRHIVDLASAQAAAGHAVGIVCNSLEGGAFEDAVIADVAPRLAFGVKRFPMRRQISPSDLRAAHGLMRHLDMVAPDVVHAHGSKGGVYGRLIGTWLGRKRPIARLYAPHGGSLHYDAGSREGRLYFAVERFLERMTDALVHVSAYEAETYRHKVGVPRCDAHVIRNGLRTNEYVPVAPGPDARDLLYLGVVRSLKGIDVFLEALARLKHEHGRVATAHVVGQATSDDAADYAAMAQRLGIADQVAFHPPRPARDAFAMARALVVPSRAESMPYVVLEAIAAALPLVATRVGGVPEILGPAPTSWWRRAMRRRSPPRSAACSPSPRARHATRRRGANGWRRASTSTPCRSRSSGSTARSWSARARRGGCLHAQRPPPRPHNGSRWTTAIVSTQRNGVVKTASAQCQRASNDRSPYSPRARRNSVQTLATALFSCQRMRLRDRYDCVVAVSCGALTNGRRRTPPVSSNIYHGFTLSRRFPTKSPCVGGWSRVAVSPRRSVFG
jgi:glycosyltransferase involved in cell wall biosynthesis